MPRLQIRDVKEELDSLIVKCSRDNEDVAHKLSQIKTAVYVLAVVQISLLAHALFGVLVR